MGEGRRRPGADACFVCGRNNPIGLGIEFHLDGDLCRGEFTPNENHGGFDGMTHGGIIFSVLDDAMANWLFLRGVNGRTARSQVRYRDALPVGKKVRLESWLSRRKGNLSILEARAVRDEDGAVVAECEGRFLVAESV